MILDLRKRADVPCGTVSLFAASLIPQDWLQSARHLPATDCRCGRYYYSWSHKQSFECKREGREP